jgi:hypothetical protein
MKKIMMFGILLTTGVFSIFGQISNDPVNKNLTIDSKVLYEHGYNKDFTATPDTPREDVDTVMVTAVMNYFVMPDPFWNGAYYLQNDYSATDLTVSEFEWTITLGTAAAQNPNPTSASPWVKVTWGATTGNATVTVKEIMPGSSGSACEGLPTVIPVHLIAKPTIGFNQVGAPPAYFDSDCYDATTVLTASYDFPITVTTSSSQVLIDYEIERTDLLSGTVTTSTVNGASVNAGTGVLQVLFGDYGDYKITITGITDRIARKCDVSGDINTGAEEFIFRVLPSPQPGTIYHVPNNF